MAFLEEQIGRQPEEFAEPLGLAGVDLALAAQDLAHHGSGPENRRQVLLPQPSLLHQVAKHVEWRNGGEGQVQRVFVYLDQMQQEPGESVFFRL